MVYKPNLIERFSTRVFGPRPPIVEEALRALDASSGSGFFGKESAVTPSVKSFYDWYETDGVVFAGVNGLAEAAVGLGYNTKETAGKRLVDEFGEVLNLDGFNVNICKNMLIAGFCPVETQVVKYASKCELKIVHPETVRKIVSGGDEYHGIEYIVQRVNNQPEVEIPGDELSWFVHNMIGNDKRGTSIIKPVEDLLAIKQDAVSNVGKIIEKRLYPPIIWLSQRDIAPVKEAIEAKEVDEDVFLGNLTPEEMKDMVKIVEIQGNTRYEGYIEQIDRLIYKGLYAPDLFYWKDATVASAQELTTLIDRNINAIQRNMKRSIEAGFFRRLMVLNGIDDVPRIVWNVKKAGFTDLDLQLILLEAIRVGLVGPDNLEGPLGYGVPPEPVGVPEDEEPEEEPEEEDEG
jgi:hypothetical protein